MNPQARNPQAVLDDFSAQLIAEPPELQVKLKAAFVLGMVGHGHVQQCLLEDADDEQDYLQRHHRSLLDLQKLMLQVGLFTQSIAPVQ